MGARAAAASVPADARDGGHRAGGGGQGSTAVRGVDIAASADLAYYLREAVRNEIASQWRRADRTPLETTLGDSIPAEATSPVEQLIGAERLRRYEAALARLEPRARTAIIGRFELGYDYDELARTLGVPSAGAARVAVCRAVKQLTQEARGV